MVANKKRNEKEPIATREGIIQLLLDRDEVTAHEMAAYLKGSENPIRAENDLRMLIGLGIIHKGKNHAEESEIHRAFRLFRCFAWDTMSINHRGSHIGMTQHCLDRPNIIISL